MAHKHEGHHKGGKMEHPHHHDGHMNKEHKMSHKGHTQGDMKPTVEDFQKPASDFAEHGFSKTLDYIERQDKHQSQMKSGLNKQAYVGRYS